MAVRRRFVLCLDGTWNSDPPPLGAQPTNALQIARRAAPQDPEGVEQVVIYEPGVGLGWSHLSGYPGWGLPRIIRRAYRRLAQAWSDGDEIFLFGISRGAFVALTIARWAHWGGLPPPEISEREVDELFAFYRGGDMSALQAAPGRRPAPIRFFGAFDAVEALGLPIQGVRAITRPHVGPAVRNLPPNIAVARHALALHERRKAFTPAVWEPPAHAGQSIEQVWFPGSHADVCGGFGRRTHSDYTLLWMMAEAEKAGLAFDPVRRNEGLRPEPHAKHSRSYGGLHRLLPWVDRRPCRTWPETERFDVSVADQQPALTQ